MLVLNQSLQEENYTLEYFKSRVKLYLGSIQRGHDHCDWTTEKHIYNKLNGLGNISKGKTIVCPSKIYSLIRMDSNDFEEFVDPRNTELNRFLNDRDTLYALSYSYYEDIVSWVLKSKNINLQIICKVCSWIREEYSVLGEKPFIKFMKFLDKLDADEGRWKEMLGKYTLKEMLWWTKADFREHCGVKNKKTKDGGFVSQTETTKKILSYREYWQSKIFLHLESTLETHKQSIKTVIKLIQNKLDDLKNSSKGNGKDSVCHAETPTLRSMASLEEIEEFFEKGGIELCPFLNDSDILEALSHISHDDTILWLLKNENINLQIICKIHSSEFDSYFRLGYKALRKFMRSLDELCLDEKKWQQIVEQPEINQVMLWRITDFRNHFGV